MKRLTLALLVSAVLMAVGCGLFGGGGGAPTGIWNGGDTTKPFVTSTVPLNGATGVALNTAITATFSEAMGAATINATTFTLKQGTTPVSGTVSYIGVTATFTPTSNLAPTTVYTGTITTGAKDVAGNALASNYVWSFTTGAAPDTTPPTVTSTVPANGATGVGINTSVTATFSEAMAPATINQTTFTLKQGVTPVLGTVTYSGVIATFTPTSNLAFNTVYTATITTGATDLAGNALIAGAVPNPWTFTTGAAPDTTPPTVILVSPPDLATGVCINRKVTATFSEAMNPATINQTTFTLKQGVTPVLGTVTYDTVTKIATFTPTSNLAASTLYTATVTTGVTDLAGNPMAANKIWSFTTGTTLCTAAVDLGAAAPFGAFGGPAGVTNQGILTVINGNIGTTGASTLITGFHDNAVAYVPPPGATGCTYTETTLNIGVVNGPTGTPNGTITIFTAPPPPTVGCPQEGTAATFLIAQNALLAAQTAWNNLSPASLPGGIDPNAGQLGGLTLPPGIYKAASGSFLLTGSDLTLDGQGDANAVFVFQTASSLTVGGPGAPRNIILIGSAQAKNVYWQVGSAATINEAGGGTMVGTIISSASTTFSTAGNVAIVTLNGRALALNASVTVVNTVINVPAP